MFTTDFKNKNLLHHQKTLKKAVPVMFFEFCYSQPDRNCYDQPELKIPSVYMDFWIVLNFWYGGFDRTESWGVLKSQTGLTCKEVGLLNNYLVQHKAMIQIDNYENI